MKRTSSPSYEPQVPTIPEDGYSAYQTSSSRRASQSASRNSTHAPSPLGFIENMPTPADGGNDGAEDAGYGDHLGASNSGPYGSSPLPQTYATGYSPSPINIPQLGAKLESTYDIEMKDECSENEYRPQTSEDFGPVSNGYTPSNNTYGNSYSNGHGPAGDDLPQNDFDEANGNSSGYEPSYGGYAPPTGGYVPYEPDPTSPTKDVDDTKASPEKSKKKKSFMDLDDDDDIMSRASEVKASSKKPAKGREVDDAVRLAAEADGTCSKSFISLVHKSYLFPIHIQPRPELC